MRILSFSNPWLWSIVSPSCRFPKKIENRSWPPPISQIGKRIALHAAKSWDDDAVGFFLRLGIDNFPARKDLYPSGVIVGVATIDRVRTCTEDERPRDIAPEQQRWAFGPFCWVLEDVRELPTAIPFRGAQGLRELPADVTAAIEAQLA